MGDLAARVGPEGSGMREASGNEKGATDTNSPIMAEEKSHSDWGSQTPSTHLVICLMSNAAKGH